MLKKILERLNFRFNRVDEHLENTDFHKLMKEYNDSEDLDLLVKELKNYIDYMEELQRRHHQGNRVDSDKMTLAHIVVENILDRIECIKNDLFVN